jgi:hypothetical protein
VAVAGVGHLSVIDAERVIPGKGCFVDEGNKSPAGNHQLKRRNSDEIVAVALRTGNEPFREAWIRHRRSGCQ